MKPASTSTPDWRYHQERHAHHRYVYVGHDPAVCALATSAIVQRTLGHPAQAARCEGEAVGVARGLRHAPSLAYALSYVCVSQATCGGSAVVIATATELMGLSEQHGLPQLRAWSLLFLGWALAQSGETADGIALLEEGLRVLSRLGVRPLLPTGLCLAAETYLAERRYAEAFEQVARAFELASETGEQWFVPRLHQVRAELLLHAHGPGDEAAEASLRQALAVARQQNAKGRELPAATSLARFWLDRGRRHAVRDLLTPIYGWFTEGFDTPDLKEAKALLDQLG
jgi:predicted ATPase